MDNVKYCDICNAHIINKNRHLQAKKHKRNVAILRGEPEEPKQKPDNREYHKKYYQTHREELIKKACDRQAETYGERIPCDVCGCSVLKKVFTEHLRSKKHRKHKAEQLAGTADEVIAAEIAERKKTRKSRKRSPPTTDESD